MRALLLLALPACLDVPPAPEVECSDDTECDTAHGEICDEGTCYGNPPRGLYAAVISPPADRNDLVPRELAMFTMSENGWVDGLQLEEAVTLSGRVEAACPPMPQACDRSTIDATITVTRGSQFPGGPGFRTVAMSEPDSAETSFAVAVPPTRSNDDPYIITIVPAGRGEEPPTMGMTPAQLVPPARIVISIAGDMTKTLQLGGAMNPVVTGTVTSSTGNGLAHHRVVAMGRWEADAPLTEVSTVHYTGSDGTFRLVLASNLVGSVEIVAKPYGDLLEPTLHLGGVPATSSSQRTLAQPAGLGLSTKLQLPVTGVDGNGAIGPVRGARVRITATVTPTAAGAATATFTAEGTTNDTGTAELEVLDGVAIKPLYRLDVVPQAAAKVGVVFDEPLSSYALPLQLQLPSRIAMTGTVFDALGVPLKDVAVTARPSLRFLWALDDQPQRFLSGIPAATTTTNAEGEYVLWVDPMLADIGGRYDLVFEPSPKTRAPAWVKPDVELPRSTPISSVAVTEIHLPDAAYVRGEILSPSGDVLEDAELKVFRLPEATISYCSELPNAPLDCPVPAVLVGRSTSDDEGMVRVGLPR